MKFDGTTGLVRIDLPGYSSPAGIIQVNSDKFTISSDQSMDWHPIDGGWCADSAFVKLTVWNGSTGIRIQIENHTDHAFKLANIRINFSPQSFSPLLDARKHVQYTQPMLPVFSGGVYRVNKEPLNREESQSYGLALLNNRISGESLLLGVMGVGPCITSFQNLHAEPFKDSEFGIGINCDFSCTIKPGTSISTTDIVVMAGNDPLSMLCRYGDLWNETVKPSFKPRITGWNSWDFYAGTVREQDVLENLDASRRDYPEVEYFVIDDGWQERWGDWNANRRFSSNFSGFADKMNSGGQIPGIWIAPYTMSIATAFSRYNQDCFVMDEVGNPCMLEYPSGPVVLLDPTHPKVQEYIREVFQNLVDAGFRYFKLDFTQALLDKHAVKFHDDTIGRMQMLRDAVSLIRDTVGEDMHILCGCMPMEASIGLLDSVRISGDIHNFWSHIVKNAGQTAASFWMHGRLWNNDPDFLIVRSDTTSSDTYLNRPIPKTPISSTISWEDGRPADEEELITWANVVLLSAGDFLLSDNLATLNERGRKIIRTALAERLDEAAVPVDLFHCPGETPSIWLGEKQGQKVLGLFNWGDDPCTLTINMRSLGITAGSAFDVWADQEVQIEDTSYIQLPPHGSKLLKLHM